MAESTCELCGKTVTVGEWPFCPHGHPTFYNDLIDYVDDNIAPEPIHFSSRRERRKYMDDHGLDFKKKFEKPPGSTLYFDRGRR